MKYIITKSKKKTTSATKQEGRAVSTAIPFGDTLSLFRSDLAVQGHLPAPYNNGTTEVLMYLVMSPSTGVAVSQEEL